MAGSTLGILHISTARSWRGGEQQLAYLLKARALSGVRHAVVCSKGSALEAYCREHAIVHYSSERRGAFDVRFARSIARAYRETQSTLIHTHDSHAHTLALLARLTAGLRSPLLVSRRVDFAIGHNVLSRYKYNHSAVCKIVCVSEAIRRVIEPDIRNKAALSVVHSGIDPERFAQPASGHLRAEYGIPAHIPLVGNVAAIAPHKDYPTFIETAAVLDARGVEARYFIIGDGPDRMAVQNRINATGLAEKIMCTGFRRDITDILPELDVFLISSRTEGLGTSVLDAFAAGVPVVACAAGGIPELVENNASGLLAPVGDAQGLADSVQRVLTDVVLRGKLAAGAKGRLKDFNYERTAALTLEAYIACAKLCGESFTRSKRKS